MKSSFCNCFVLLFLSIFLSGCTRDKNPDTSNILPLNGNWQFSLDTAQVGIQKEWFLKTLNDKIELPGTTDLRKKGIINNDTTTLHLNRPNKYEGAAWYRRKINIPANFKGKQIELFLERTKVSKIWIDSLYIGKSHLLQSPQKFNITDYATPGDHYITVMVNNDLDLTPYGNVHIYSDDTQTNWNGILGDMHLEAFNNLRINSIKIHPDIQAKRITVDLEIDNDTDFKDFEIILKLNKNVESQRDEISSKKYKVKDQPKIQLTFEFKNDIKLWDEFDQPLYELEATVYKDSIKSTIIEEFGMREFQAKGRKFTINGLTTFLRGKHDAAVFPITGYPPMTTEEWKKVYRIAKSYGINHYRFHTYCPPEAAFKAADELGIYLQVELPFWGGMDSDSIAKMQFEEGKAMLDEYGNHPSFVLFSPGNEIWSGHDRVAKYIKKLKAYDNRPLYTMGSNNNIGYLKPGDYVDFFVGSRTPSASDNIETHTRLTHAYADSQEGGILNTKYPSTTRTFDDAVSRLSIPVISHEIGQYQIYPDYEEIHKYTGVLKPWNLISFQKNLEKSGMAEMDSIFQKASGAWAALCYKAEMETALRTDSLAGFQLLDLQDFPGQGTALVGILDAFMDSKNVISKEKWKQSCSDITLLAEFSKYCWTTDEKFQADIIVSNYGKSSINEPLQWSITSKDRDTIAKGQFQSKESSQGGNTYIGTIQADLNLSEKAGKLNFHLELNNSLSANDYSIWVYEPKSPVVAKEILVKHNLDNELFDRLNAGGKVLLFPDPEIIKNNSFPGHFPPEFWNYGMFKSISENVNKPVSPGTLGLLIDSQHPIFEKFPTDNHTNWQWFSIIKASNAMIIDQLPNALKPIVQVIDNLERNHKLGMIYELKIGKGKLLICTSQLPKIFDQPEAVLLYNSIIKYMESENFNPKVGISKMEMENFF
ncbi:sugar-binding domain-containing protein [Zunongwangia atlantica]|uniref:sugar-binding domain-containing protein n=1 Tax=Zunongwangia atlantica TaxID=1502297 RepID=UPI000A108F30|nr:sugar-binding domain-containing protein [Zunongwangia atlantica]